MDPMKRVAAGAVRKNLGPDPSMGRKVELLRRLVSMRQERDNRRAFRPERGRRSDPDYSRGFRPEGKRSPRATTNPPSRSRSVPTRLPRYDRMGGM